ncbi:hypothetical protein BDN72DRAFT_847347 [Pluteus cervinus]|uniref:Uncharacterized protein n=1 Tax=Pluteus cervinus TaxID=181527 RepID=A0ACD3ACQ3_9AGAR|nr:hypothetical protein BDN72DRAFT_847347 [Pluteus cervinus]
MWNFVRRFGSHSQRLALNNDDTLRQILGYLAIGSEPIHAFTDNTHESMKSSRKDLYSAALVSRSFAPPALDLLWQAMNSVKPLINLLPMVHRGHPTGFSVAYDTRNLEPDVKRFISYADKVQVFYYLPEAEPEADLDWEFFHALKNHPAIPSPLLPKLHTLYVSSLPADSNHAVLFHTLSTSLRFVKVSSWATASPHLIRTFVTCLLSQAHMLHQFQVGDLDRMPKDVQGHIFSFRQLRTMRITSLNQMIFSPTSALAELVNLETLSMDISSQSSMPLDNASIPCHSVKVLHITWNIPPLFDLLAALETPNICELHLTSRRSKQTVERSMGSLLGAIAKWSSSLRILNITQIRTKYLLPVQWSLVRFEHLESMTLLIIDSPHPPAEMSYWELARCLPNLKRLSLPFACPISLTSLITIIFLCPHLHFLQTSLDTRRVSLLDVINTTAAFPNNLQTLSMDDTTVLTDPFLVARNLIIFFPNLTRIISTSPTWNSINDILMFARSLDVAKSQHQTISADLSQKLRTEMACGDVGTLPKEMRLR